MQFAHLNERIMSEKDKVIIMIMTKLVMMWL